MNEEGAQLRDESVPHLAMLAGTPEGSTSLPPHGRNMSPGSTTLGRSQGGPAVERERRLYVFDREHLDAEPELVAQSLAITDEQLLGEPPLGRAFFQGTIRSSH